MLKSMLFAAICVSLIVVKSSVADNNEIRHFQLNDAQLIWSSDDTMAISHPGLHQFGWRSVTVENQETLTIVNEDCDTLSLNRNALTEEQINSLLAAVNELQSVDDAKKIKKLPKGAQYCASIWRIDGSSHKIKQCNTKHQFTAGTTGEGDPARVFFNEEVATFVYRDGKIRMRPIKCLHELEKNFLDYVEGQAEKDGHVNVHREPKKIDVGQFGRKLIECVQSVCQSVDNKIKQMKAPRSSDKEEVGSDESDES